MFVTYPSRPSGVTATRLGFDPTVTGAPTTEAVARSTKETVPPPALATTAVRASGVTATPSGVVPTGTVAVTTGGGTAASRMETGVDWGVLTTQNRAPAAVAGGPGTRAANGTPSAGAGGLMS